MFTEGSSSWSSLSTRSASYQSVVLTVRIRQVVVPGMHVSSSSLSVSVSVSVSAMDLIHKFLYVVLPLLALIAILLFMPPFLIYTFFHYLIKAFIPTEKFTGNVVLVTGASLGIGENLAYKYARRGARLTQVARRAERLKAVAAKDVGLGSPDAFVIRADVSEIEDCKRLV
ncbi:hypothetical protein TIFTF001_048502 [Ficus carica]|uniref:Uncharacterized protein n=1 Tax=Ficus carica TaxID=3494 RepID=A0AA87YN92_FICCA|nr:hypothetical protein TIFTF001_048492 [Ficus carica]GMN18657.1 hypothetical protein TIFTF001_048495 [Ficus carica]GMN18663.1 hypothetical protein TIFTF001_048499 [Ficus carica]GMN18669.1 hypothetical protein TIFTF001_048502 [Ficus carica]